jgi:hypothetical protein
MIKLYTIECLKVDYPYQVKEIKTDDIKINESKIITEKQQIESKNFITPVEDEFAAMKDFDTLFL